MKKILLVFCLMASVALAEQRVLFVKADYTGLPEPDAMNDVNRLMKLGYKITSVAALGPSRGLAGAWCFVLAKEDQPKTP